MRPIILILCIIGLGATYGEEEKVFRVAGTDSYLEAYKAIRGDSVNALLDDAVKKTDREYVENGGYPYPNPQPQYGPPSGPPNYNYGPPRPQYGPPSPGPAYGPPTNFYGPPNPAPAYGPPAPAYGPPAPAYGPPNPPPPPPPPPVYGPPAPGPSYNPFSSVQVFYGVPHAMLSFWDKLKLKLDLFTIGKILLKLVIFKKIVSFIAIICLLLFIPALKHKGENDNDNYMSSDEDDMMGRSFNNTRISSYDEKLNILTAYVVEAIENFSQTEGSRANCNNTYCKTQKILKKLDKNMSYKRLATLYSKELQA